MLAGEFGVDVGWTFQRVSHTPSAGENLATGRAWKFWSFNVFKPAQDSLQCAFLGLVHSGVSIHQYFKRREYLTNIFVSLLERLHFFSQLGNLLVVFLKGVIVLVYAVFQFIIRGVHGVHLSARERHLKSSKMSADSYRELIIPTNRFRLC
jgi:hypothetical protein